jgi:hypothetical protein
MAKTVNFFGSPGAGKSTSAAELFVALKRAHYKCELVVEYAKELVYGRQFETLKDQRHIFQTQLERIERPASAVDFVINDSPIILSIIYGEHETPEFHQSCLDKFFAFDNVNFFIPLCVDNYKTYGRMQTVTESEVIENKIKALLQDKGIPFYVVRNGLDAFEHLCVSHHLPSCVQTI